MSNRHQARGRGGFTLIEVLLAITIGGSLLIAAVAFALSMGEVWGSGTDRRVFDQHVRGVARFLESLMRQAEAPPEPAEGGIESQETQAEQQERQEGRQALGTSEGRDAPVVWQSPRGNSFGSDELLTFQLPESPGVFAWPEQPLPFVVCALRVDPRRGLQLLWKSRLEIDFEDQSPREMAISPYVTGITYFYYDAEAAQPAWESDDRPRRGDGGTLIPPQRIRLAFEYLGETRTADIIVPTAKMGVPVY